MEIKGKLIQKLPLQTGTGRTGTGWQKQEFIVETMEQYPKQVCINLWGDKADMLQSIAIGDVVTASVSVESREYNGRWYTDVRAWKLVKEVAGNNNAEPQPVGQSNFNPEPIAPMSVGENDTFTDDGAEDDLPF